MFAEPTPSKTALNSAYDRLGNSHWLIKHHYQTNGEHPTNIRPIARELLQRVEFAGFEIVRAAPASCSLPQLHPSKSRDEGRQPEAFSPHVSVICSAAPPTTTQP